MQTPQFNPGLMQAPDVGGQFMQGFQQGQERRKQNITKAAMAALVRDPANQKALEALAEADPQAAMQFQQQQQTHARNAIEQHREQIKIGAQIIRQFGVRDQATLDQALGAARQYGLPLDGIPTVWNEQTAQYVNGMTQLADTFDPPKQPNMPSSYEEYMLAQKDPNYAKHLEERRGPLIANNGDGTFTIVPRAMVSGGQQGADPPPPPPGFVIDSDGGPTPPASGTFPN